MSLLIFFSYLSVHAQVLDTSALSMPALKEGQCATLTDSKVYLKDLKYGEKTSSYQKIINEIGTDIIKSIDNDAKSSYFFCKVRCVLNSKEERIWIQQKDLNENFKNMNGFVCPGLDIQDVALSPTLTIKTSVSLPYSAVQSQFMGIRIFLKKINYQVPPELLTVLINEFYNSLNMIIGAYTQSSSPVLKKAAEQLMTYTALAPNSWDRLKEKISTLAVKQWINDASDSTSGLKSFENPEYFVNQVLITQGHFLEFVP